jgi:hypothetical protein
MGRRWLLVVAALLVAVRIIALAADLPHAERMRPTHVSVGDVARYRAIARAPGRAYRDRAVEFPPVSLVAIEAITAPTRRATVGRLAWTMLAFDIVTGAALALGFGVGAAVVYLALTLTLMPFVLFRIDLLSVALAVVGAALIARGRERGGGIVLALAALAKVWPVLAVPLLWRAQRRAAVWCAGALAVLGAAWVAYGGPAGPGQVLGFRGARGWHLESVPGSLARLVMNADPRLESGSWRTAPIGRGFSVLLGLAFLVLAVAVLARVRGSSPWAGEPMLLLVVALLVTAPLLSPQYIAWVAPWSAVAVAGAGGSRRAAAVRAAVLIGAAGVFSNLVIMLFGDVVAGTFTGHLVVLTRNALLGAVLVEGLRPRQWSRHGAEAPAGQRP